MKSLILAAAVALAAANPAAAQTRAFDPRAYQDRHVGEPTQILVLGTMHLSETPDSFDPAVLAPLLDRLAAFRPDAITIEALSRSRRCRGSISRRCGSTAKAIPRWRARTATAR